LRRWRRSGDSNHSDRGIRMSVQRHRELLSRPGVGAAAFRIRDAVLGEVENPAEVS